MLQKLKDEFHKIRASMPGQRFMDHYERRRQSEDPQESFLRTSLNVTAGFLLLIVGLLLSIPPGVPGFLLWVFGLAILAARFRSFARLLDKAELVAVNTWHRIRDWWRKTH